MLKGIILSLLAILGTTSMFTYGGQAQDKKLEALSVEVHYRRPIEGGWTLPKVETEGKCNGNGTNIVVNKSAKPFNVVLCRISKRPGQLTREFIKQTIPGGTGNFTVGCSRNGDTIYGYEVHWWDPDTTYFPEPITEGRTALVRGGNVLENRHQFKAIEVSVANRRGQTRMYVIRPDKEEAIPDSWTIRRASYIWSYDVDKCNDGRG